MAEGLKKFRGVNLGGWLVLEKWMTPSLFAGTDAIDEYTFMQTSGAVEKLRNHQKNFIREEDFRWMARHGINAVRIPIGYWIFEGDDPYRSSIGRLDWAVRMARQYGIDVLICLHGAPGSQNGRDHSGRIGPALWYKSQLVRDKTTEVLVELARRYRDEPVVWGIELLNEPKLGLFNITLRRFYAQARQQMIAVARPGLAIVFSDAFTPRLMSGALSPTQSHPVVMDTHWYHFLIWKHMQRWIPLKFYYWWWVTQRGRMLERLSRQQPIIVGEWNGIIGGEKLSRYPEDQHKAIVREHIRRQLAAYRPLKGWFYWSYKHERPGVFHFRSLVEDGTIELTRQDLDD